MAFRHRGNRWLPWVGLAASLLVIAAVAAVVVLSGREGDYSNPNAEFGQTETQPAHEAPQKPPKKGHPADDGFRWPLFGLDPARTRVLPLREPFRPPFRVAWRVRAHQLLEFTSVLCGRSVFLLGDGGDLYKVSRWTGQVQWKRHLGTLAASSPACGGDAVYAVLLRRSGSGDGRIVALDRDKGRVRWSRRLPSRAESSPLLFKGRLYFGTYGGHVYALRRGNGRLVWNKHVAAGGAFGLGSGNFYSTPAVDYGRVYIGATNGAVYSLSARTGAVAWRKHTGNYVYASPAVDAVAGGPPTVWIGSYNGSFYALDARTGATRWERGLGGKLSGSPTVIGDLVFQSSFNKRTTWALGANTGRTLWHRNRGAFTAAISDGRRIYFNGYGTLYGLDPKGRHFANRPPPRHTPARRQRAIKKQQAAARASKGAKPRARHKSARKKAARARAAKRARAAHRRFCHRHPRAKRCH
jgi:outer membrane protein assembly factor BamB